MSGAIEKATPTTTTSSPSSSASSCQSSSSSSFHPLFECGDVLTDVFAFLGASPADQFKLRATCRETTRWFDVAAGSYKMISFYAISPLVAMMAEKEEAARRRRRRMQLNSDDEDGSNSRRRCDDGAAADADERIVAEVAMGMEGMVEAQLSTQFTEEEEEGDDAKDVDAIGHRHEEHVPFWRFCPVSLVKNSETGCWRVGGGGGNGADTTLLSSPSFGGGAGAANEVVPSTLIINLRRLSLIARLCPPSSQAPNPNLKKNADLCKLYVMARERGVLWGAYSEEEANAKSKKHDTTNRRSSAVVGGGLLRPMYVDEVLGLLPPRKRRGGGGGTSAEPLAEKNAAETSNGGEGGAVVSNDDDDDDDDSSDDEDIFVPEKYGLSLQSLTGPTARVSSLPPSPSLGPATTHPSDIDILRRKILESRGVNARTLERGDSGVGDDAEEMVEEEDDNPFSSHAYYRRFNSDYDSLLWFKRDFLKGINVRSVFFDESVRIGKGGQDFLACSSVLEKIHMINNSGGDGGTPSSNTSTDHFANVTDFGKGFLRNSLRLKRIELHRLKSLMTLKDETLSNCPALRSVTLPKTITDIGDDCFRQCSALRSFDLVNLVRLQRVGDGFLSRCGSLLKVSIKGTPLLESIGKDFLFGATSLRRMIFDTTVDPSASSSSSTIAPLSPSTAAVAANSGAFSPLLTIEDGFLKGCPQLLDTRGGGGLGGGGGLAFCTTNLRLAPDGNHVIRDSSPVDGGDRTLYFKSPRAVLEEDDDDDTKGGADHHDDDGMTEEGDEDGNRVRRPRQWRKDTAARKSARASRENTAGDDFEVGDAKNRVLQHERGHGTVKTAIAASSCSSSALVANTMHLRKLTHAQLTGREVTYTTYHYYDDSGDDDAYDDDYYNYGGNGDGGGRRSYHPSSNTNGGGHNSRRPYGSSHYRRGDGQQQGCTLM